MLIFWCKIKSLLQSKNTSTFKTKKQWIGKQGEDIAVNYLKKKGFRIVHRNWRCASLELDIVCEDVQGFVFIEVKTRTVQSMTSPLEGVNQKKRYNILKAAQSWLSYHDAWQCSCRFAIVAVTYDSPQNFNVEFYDNAFNFD